jgi:anthranilate phosphoribosyltransferase
VTTLSSPQPTLPVADEFALRSATRQAVRGRDLSSAEAYAAISTMLAESTDPREVIAFLTAMSGKGPSPVELAEAVRAIVAAAEPIEWQGNAVDIVGTGGDGSDSVNISTIAALIASAAGAVVAKSGNRAATSRCGSADLLEALGIPIQPLSQVGLLLDRYRFAFVYTRELHPALARLAPIRRRLAFPTLLNLAGPLANPVPSARLIGAANDQHLELIAGAAQLLGMRHVWVVRGADGMDELTTTGTNRVIAIAGELVEEFELAAGELGLVPADRARLRGSDSSANATVTRRILAGGAPALRDTCLLNAAATLRIAGITGDLASGVALARAAVADAAATRLLAELARTSTTVEFRRPLIRVAGSNTPTMRSVRP